MKKTQAFIFCCVTIPRFLMRNLKKGLLISFLSDYIAHSSYNRTSYEHIAIVNYSGITAADVEKTARLLIDIYM